MICQLLLAISFSGPAAVNAASKPPVHVWLEPEWFDGVRGNFAYWTGTAKPAGAWGIAGPGISAEWTQGGESEWNSIGVPAEEIRAVCSRVLTIPRTGKYTVWVRYVDHRRRTEPFKVSIKQTNRPSQEGVLGLLPVVPENDEYQLYWGFSFCWSSFAAELHRGPASLELEIDRAGQAWRQVDAILLTTDPAYEPVAREKPPFAYLKTLDLKPPSETVFRGDGSGLKSPGDWGRSKLAGRDFSMWATLETDPAWWQKQTIDKLQLSDVFFQLLPPADIRKEFHRQFAGRKDLPILSWPKLIPGLYLATPDLSPGTPLRRWLEQTRTPFFILTNYAGPQYTTATGPATYAALTGPLAEQFLGYIHGEAVGSPGVSLPDKPLGASRRQHVDALVRELPRAQAAAWSNVYKTAVPDVHWQKGISCLSVDSIALAHLFREAGSKTVGYEIDATNVHAPMRIAFERGAARQYGGTWINYASGNFGDACNYFTQNPVVPRGAPGWFHSKYAVTDGVSIAWYRKLYYLNYLGGAAAIFWEQGLGNQWMLPGPGSHPIQLSPFGRATEDFLGFVDRLPDRGQPYVPIALLLSHGHSYERVNYSCKMLNVFPESREDVELRELFNVCWQPSAILEGKPAAPDIQSMVGGTHGNIFDVLVDRPQKAEAVFHYSVVYAAGDVDLSGRWPQILADYVHKGGTLVLHAQASKPLPNDLLGLKFLGRTREAEGWRSLDGVPRGSLPYLIEQVELNGAKVLAWADEATPLITRNALGAGAVIVVLVPHAVCLDERAHPALPYLMNGLTAGLLPVEVKLANGSRPAGEVLYQVNQTKDGYLVLLINNLGIDKTQSGVARVDRREVVDLVLESRKKVAGAREFTNPRPLNIEQANGRARIRLRIHPGDVQVVGLTVQP